MHYVFIMNYFADKKRMSAAEKAILELKKNKDEYVHVHVTEYAGHAGDLASEYADKYGEDALIIACGGDGTVHEISNSLALKRTPMTVLPMGTGNDFARSVLPQEFYEHPERIIPRLDQYSIRPVDVMRIESYDEKGVFLPDCSGYSINITSFGIDTAVQAQAKKIIQSAKHLRLIRRNAYSIATLICILRGWDYKLKYRFILADGNGTAEGGTPYCLACICNGQYYGNGFHPAPDALIDDGVLNVSVVEDMPLSKVIPLVPRYKNGTHLPHPNIRTFRVTGGVLTAADGGKPLDGNYEGEDFYGSQVRFEVVPGAIQFAFFSI